MEVMIALIRVYIANGNRGDRKKARLKHLLETWTLDQYLAEGPRCFWAKAWFARPSKTLAGASRLLPSRIPHIGAFPQMQSDRHYLGVAVPRRPVDGEAAASYRRSGRSIRRGRDPADGLAKISSFPTFPTAALETVKDELRRAGLDWKQSNVAGGVIACTGKKYCKFSLTETKGHALELVDHLENRLELDVPVNIHVTGCPHSCAQHYMGDIGLLGTKRTRRMRSLSRVRRRRLRKASGGGTPGVHRRSVRGAQAAARENASRLPEEPDAGGIVPGLYRAARSQCAAGDFL